MKFRYDIKLTTGTTYGFIEAKNETSAEKKVRKLFQKAPHDNFQDPEGNKVKYAIESIDLTEVQE